MEEIKLVQVHTMSGGKWDKMNDMSRRVYDENGLSPTITTMGGGNLQPKIMETIKIQQATKAGTIECEIGGAFDMSYHESKTRRGRVQENGNVSPTITAQNQEIGVVLPKCRIRKLTPRECWRLMGFSDEDFDNASKVNSDSQLYKQAGNSIVVDVLAAIFGRMV